MKILLVEDDITAATVLAKALAAHNYQVNTANDGQTAWELAEMYDYDLVVLDLVLPCLDGISLCRQLRSTGRQMPILLLTAKDHSSDRVLGLDAGADDYVTKPYDLAELLARIRALLRRGSAHASNLLTWEKLQVNPDSGVVTYADTPIHLTRKEYRLVELFLYNPQRIFSRSALLDHVWSMDEFPGEGAVNTQIKGLRQKLKNVGMTTEMIETVYGLGYRLKTPPIDGGVAGAEPGVGEKEKVRGVLPVPSAPSTSTSRQAAEAKVRAFIATVMAELRQNLPDRLGVFHTAIVQLQSGHLTAEVQTAARAEAHRMIGTLGSLDQMAGSAIARQIEQLLLHPTVPEAETAQQLADLLQSLQLAIANDDRGDGLTGKEGNGEAEEMPALSTAQPPTPKSPLPLPRLLVIDDDAILTEQLQLEAGNWGMQVEIAADPTVARRAIADCKPDVILLDLTFQDTAEDGLALLAELTERGLNIPVLVFSARNDLRDRIEVARLGGQRFLHKPIAPRQVFQAINQVIKVCYTSTARVLIVDDDPVVLAQLTALLEPWAFQITTLTDPTQFWNVLEQAMPDLLILDVEMPEFNGIELCQVVRNDPRWEQMPILFLSAHTDATTIQQVFVAGADDFVVKPIVGPELIARILNRLERVQMLRKLLETSKGESFLDPAIANEGSYEVGTRRAE